MNKEEFDNLQQKAKKYIGKEMHIFVSNNKNETEYETYKFIKIGGSLAITEYSNGRKTIGNYTDTLELPQNSYTNKTLSVDIFDNFSHVLDELKHSSNVKSTLFYEEPYGILQSSNGKIKKISLSAIVNYFEE